jgi:predicted enzyme related to lactoylglutathione lyase
MDWKIELLAVPVSDIDRAKEFYVDKVGFHDDVDQTFELEGQTGRFVQLTPPGSGCSITLDTGMTGMKPGQLAGIQMVVDDADAALQHLTSRGVETDGGVQDFPWGRFVFFKDPDGSGWAVQQLPGWVA